MLLFSLLYVQGVSCAQFSAQRNTYYSYFTSININILAKWSNTSPLTEIIVFLSFISNLCRLHQLATSLRTTCLILDPSLRVQGLQDPITHQILET